MNKHKRIWISAYIILALIIVGLVNHLFQYTVIGRDISQRIWGLNVLHYSELIEKFSRSDRRTLEQGILVNRERSLHERPILSSGSGVYPNGVIVTISLPKETRGYYSLDGSIPTTKHILVTGAIHVSKSIVLRVRAFSDTGSSETTTATYLVSNSDAAIASIVMDPVHLFDKHAGIYTNPKQKGRGWERPAELTLIDPLSNKLLQADVSIRIHGGSSRGLPNLGRKSFRVYVDRQKADVRSWTGRPIEISDDQSEWVLRHVGSERQLWSDRFALRIAHEMGILASSARPFILYLNGTLWGVYDLMERVNEEFLIGKEGAQRFDLLHGIPLQAPHKVNPKFSEWNSLYRYISDNDLSDSHIYSRIEAQIDVDSLIDYFALSIFLADSDRPHNNIDMYRVKKQSGMQSGKWKFVAWDFDHGLNVYGKYTQLDTLAWHLRTSPRIDLKPAGSPDSINLVSSTTLLRAFMKNEGFRRKFIQRFNKLLETTFSSDNLHQTLNAVLHDYSDVLELEKRRFNRPEDWLIDNLVRLPETTSGYTYDHRMEEIYNFLSNRTDFVRQFLKEHFVEIIN